MFKRLSAKSSISLLGYLNTQHFDRKKLMSAVCYRPLKIIILIKISKHLNNFFLTKTHLKVQSQNTGVLGISISYTGLAYQFTFVLYIKKHASGFNYYAGLYCIFFNSYEISKFQCSIFLKLPTHLIFQIHCQL